MQVTPAPNGVELLNVSAPEYDTEFEIYGSCPIQAFGATFDRELYFRARHGDWWFELADSDGKLPSDGGASADGFYYDGHYDESQPPSLRKCVRIIAKCLEQFWSQPNDDDNRPAK